MVVTGWQIDRGPADAPGHPDGLVQEKSIALPAPIAAAVVAAVAPGLLAGRRTGLGTRAPGFPEQDFTRQLDPVLVVDGNHFNLHAVANLADAIDLVHVLVVQL